MQTYEKVHTSISTFQTNFDLDSFDYEEYYFSFLKFSNLYIYLLSISRAQLDRRKKSDEGKKGKPPYVVRANF